MRLTLSTLPQLAVLAKILCLLMVVMCGAVPAMVRSVSLYSACSSENITVMGRTLKTSAKNDDTAPFQLLTTQSDDFSKKIYIYAEKSQRYICFNKHWKPVALLKKQRNERCQFYESYNMAGFLRYRSAVNSKHMLGFNKFGKPIKNQRGRQECFNFIKYNARSLVNRLDRHNDLVSGNTGGQNGKGTGGGGGGGGGGGRGGGGGGGGGDGERMQRDPVNTRKSSSGPHHQHRAKKNSLQADEVPRETMITTTSHRHRHSNRLKQPHEDVPSPRRRHHQSRLLEASKY